MVVLDTTKPRLEVEFSYNTDVYSKIMHVYTCYPQIAIWISADDSHESQTVYVTHKGGKNDFSFADARPSAIPVWDGVHEQEKNLNVDGISGATPMGESNNVTWIIPPKFLNKRVNVYIEANLAFDYNEFYPKKAKSGQLNYSDVNGQPSLVWLAQLDFGKDPEDLEPDLIGHGQVLGKNDRIDKDLSTVTTAKEMFHHIIVRYIPAIN